MAEAGRDGGWLARRELAALMPRRDGPGLLRLAFQTLLLLGSGGATLHFAAAGHPAWIPSVLLCGVAVTLFFPSMHEAGHAHAFRTPIWNEVTLWLSAFLMLQTPSFFREFHWQHHRATQDRENDPEIQAAPSLLDGWPGNPFLYALVASGQMLLFGKPALTLGCALLPAGWNWAWERAFPYVRPEYRRRVAWESRFVLLLLGGIVYWGWQQVPGFPQLLLAWPISHLLLGLYLMPEHTGLPNTGSQLVRTRTLESNAVLRWLMWNMPYHSEHHAYPGVPFHALGSLHAQLAPHLVNTTPGYLAFHREAVARALGRR